jgi:hypothetical protein
VMTFHAIRDTCEQPILLAIADAQPGRGRMGCGLARLPFVFWHGGVGLLPIWTSGWAGRRAVRGRFQAMRDAFGGPAFLAIADAQLGRGRTGGGLARLAFVFWHGGVGLLPIWTSG